MFDDTAVVTMKRRDPHTGRVEMFSERIVYLAPWRPLDAVLRRLLEQHGAELVSVNHS